MTSDKKISMIMAANLALGYKRQKPNAENEEIFGYIVRMMKTAKETRIFGIAGANFALKYLEKNPRATEKEIMQKLSNETSNILNSIENQEMQY